MQQEFKVKAKRPSLKDQGPKKQTVFYKQCHFVCNRLKVFKMQVGAGLHTKNCVYFISCTVFDIQYVGETGNTIRTSFHTQIQHL